MILLQYAHIKLFSVLTFFPIKNKKPFVDMQAVTFDHQIDPNSEYALTLQVPLHPTKYLSNLLCILCLRKSSFL